MTLLFHARLPFLLLLLAFAVYFAWVHLLKER